MVEEIRVSGENHRLTQSHWHLSNMRPPWLEQRQWWETVSSQWQRHNLDHSTIRVGPYKAIEQRQVIGIFLTCLQSRNLNPRSSRLVSNAPVNWIPGRGGPGHAGILLRKKSINSTHPHWQGPIMWQYAPPPGHAQQKYTRLWKFCLCVLILPRRAVPRVKVRSWSTQWT